MAAKYVAEGSVTDFAMGMRKARAIDAAAAIYLEAKIRIETERAAACAQAEFDAAAEASERTDPFTGSCRLEYLTEDEVSEYLRIPVNTLRDWRRKDAVKVLPFHKIGRLIRYERTEIDVAMRAGLVEASPDRDR